MGGEADNHVVADQFPDFFNREIILSHMDPIRSNRQSEMNVVVDNKARIVSGGQISDGQTFPISLLHWQVLLAILDNLDTSFTHLLDYLHVGAAQGILAGSNTVKVANGKPARLHGSLP